jgi:hypothetical protein
MYEVTIPEGVFSPPNALRLVQHVGGLHPHFPSLPHTFSIPSHSDLLAASFAFIKAMRATVRWNKHWHFPKLLTKESISKEKSTGRKHYFKLEFTCPCQGFSNPPLNSRKSQHVSAWCGCTARFSIAHNLESDSLRVTWCWQHTHDPNSREDMILARAPIAVDDWLKERVESGLGWPAIQNLIRTPYIGLVSPQSNYIFTVTSSLHILS